LRRVIADAPLGGVQGRWLDLSGPTPYKWSTEVTRVVYEGKRDGTIEWGPAGKDLAVIPQALIRRGYAKALGEAVEAWKQDHDEASKVRTLEELIPDALALRDRMRDDHKRMFEALFAGKLAATQLVGQLTRETFANTLLIFEVFAAGIGRAEGRGYEVGRAREFERAFEDVRRLSEDFSRRWPLFDVQELEQARARIASGEGLTAEDIRRELDGPD
jgi:hypothetical protein